VIDHDSLAVIGVDIHGTGAKLSCGPDSE